VQVFEPGADVDALWAFDADLLVALLLIIVLFGNLAMDACVGRIDLLYYYPTPPGFMLIDIWRSARKARFWPAVRI